MPPRPTDRRPRVKPQISHRLGCQSSHPISPHLISRAVISTMKSERCAEIPSNPNPVYMIHDPSGVGLATY